ncbi:MAG: membrane dipeptidase [Clostridia bacterium]|nr:membrane dipeptidase [Clostridia bacterium]
MRFNCNVFDCHCDTLTIKNLTHTKSHLKYGDMLKYNRYIQVFAICAEKCEPYMHALHHIRRYNRLTRKYAIEKVEQKSDLRRARQGAILALEGGDALYENIYALDRFYKMGVRLLTLTWNNENAVAGNITQDFDGGLTPFGKKIIRRCEELGVVVDLSHIGDRSFFDVCAASEKPFICSHSNSRSICGEMRNITDNQFRELMRRGGVLGINFYPLFLGGEGSIKEIVKHIEHFCGMGGEKNIGMGSDFDGISHMPKGCSGASFFADIANELLRLNYKEEITQNILFDNFYNLFEKLL